MPKDSDLIYMTLSDLTSIWGQEDFASRLLESISNNAEKLPLTAVCSTGAPRTEDGVACSDLRCERQSPNQLRGSFAYAFTEETNLGCSDQHYTDRVRGRFYFTYDLHTSELTVDVPQVHAEYDPEEI